eukprot:TRINITY_DN2615_c0_g1_i1.p1 TRINITY_DN2615_c0_g1~~TRINITY_DN2615_c0_g1_i1.p1  ORF type:complete len:466 (+),score=89.34 TRINITY_DN2615_c0_g1_i1:73-1470(+)
MDLAPHNSQKTSQPTRPMQPRAWVFKEPMVVVPVGSVVQAAVTMGNDRRAMTPMEAEAAARDLVRTKGIENRTRTPEEAVREARKIFSEIHHPESGYYVDLRASPRTVVVSQGTPPHASSHHAADPYYSSLQNEVALLRDELLRSDYRKEMELQQARDELRSATNLLHQFTRQNAELQAQLNSQADAATRGAKQQKPNITLRDMTKLQGDANTLNPPPTGPGAGGLSALTLADYAAHQERRGLFSPAAPPPPPPPPQDESHYALKMTQPQVELDYAPPQRRQSEILETESVKSHKSARSLAQSVKSAKSSASVTQARMGRPNTAIACDNDVVDLDMESVKSVRSQRAAEAAEDAQSVRSVRSVRSQKSSASATQARMGRANTAIACDNDVVDLDLDTPKSIPASQPRSLAGGQDQDPQPFSDTASRASRASRTSAKSSASATKARMGKGNTAIACDNDEVDLGVL